MRWYSTCKHNFCVCLWRLQLRRATGVQHGFMRDGHVAEHREPAFTQPKEARRPLINYPVVYV